MTYTIDQIRAVMRGHTAAAGEINTREALMDCLAHIDAQATKIAVLLEIVNAVTLFTDEGDDRAVGTHYVDKAGVIRCKGSFLETVFKARAAMKEQQK